MSSDAISDPSTWDPALDAVAAAPANHRVLFENDRLRVLEVILEPDEEEPTHHHRWPSVFVFDQVQGPIHDRAGCHTGEMRPFPRAPFTSVGSPSDRTKLRSGGAGSPAQQRAAVV